MTINGDLSYINIYLLFFVVFFINFAKVIVCGACATYIYII